MTGEPADAPRIAAADLPEPWRSMAVTVVVPTYNEAANLPVLAEALSGLPLSGLRVLAADDGSTSRTESPARARRAWASSSNQRSCPCVFAAASTDAGFSQPGSADSADRDARTSSG
jgi:hypothetical protein